MVRLKGIDFLDKNGNASLFQFLMVRLKVFLSSKYPVTSFSISIPYGAIKRDVLLIEGGMFIIISIPYGAIKSFLEVGIIGSPKPFQFLMVRLKELEFFPYGKFKDISIPYGAIKSAGATLVEFLVILFQFLMVRLKDNYYGNLRYDLQGFQFLMVRLKVLLQTAKKRSGTPFQFLMVRLKVN